MERIYLPAERERETAEFLVKIMAADEEAQRAALAFIKGVQFGQATAGGSKGS